jgi:exodeoxyribonuclease V beta subunit
MNRLNPYEIPLESINLIEASAGTGKSWTVTLLYLRLILEKNYTVDQILVVTFTDAATKELRDDIRNRIVAALEAFSQADYQNDDEYKRLLDKCDDKEEALLRLNRAKLSMDEAAVFTIHGFCQRSLSENAFEANLPFESELLEDDSEIMQKLTDDFWRRRFFKAPRSLIFKLHQKKITPDSLLKDIFRHVGKPYLGICGPESEEVKAEKWQELEELFARAVQTWREQGDEIWQLLTRPDLNEKGYQSHFKNARKIISHEMASIALSDSVPGNIDEKLSWLGIKDKTLKAFDPIEHPFFQQWQDFLDLWTELDKSSDDFLNNIRIELLQHLQTELPKEKQRLGVLSFDDLLLQMQQALQAHPQLAEDLYRKYPAALIDEFQDTDPIQYDIFSAIYASQKNQTVFLVGDPKQAIYSFRGGDIHTYLKAKADTSEANHYTLDKNWRSHPDLINAFNALYSQSKNPFKDEGIEYVNVDSGDKSTAELVLQSNDKPLRLWQFETDEDKPTADFIRKQIADAVAGDIATLLNQATNGDAKIGDKAISGGDIAILVRSHNQADIIKAALNARGVTSVQSSKESIYDTHEAVEMLYLLTAIAAPQKEDEIRRSLVTEMMGRQAEDLIRYQTDSNAWEDVLIAMQNYHHQWNKQGFLPMMRSLMNAENMYQRLMDYEDGERRLSNILQLSELIHSNSRQQMLGMTEVLRWLKKQQENAASKETELRLESDDDLVKIVTIHKSKGLEYPIVYCPFVGMSGSSRSDKIFTFHKDKQSYLEIGSANSEEHKALKAADESAEDTRLLYVALTRAKYQCTVVCFPQAINGSPDKSAFGWLLTDGRSIPSGSSAAAKKAKQEYFEAYNQNLQTLSENNPNISLTVLPEYPVDLKYQPEESDETLTARVFSAEIKKQAQITSFSGLTAGAHAETPDYDSLADSLQMNAAAAQNAIEVDEFPRGATAGTVLHEIYENLDFIKPVEEQMDVIETSLKKYGFDQNHQASAMQLMQQSLQAELAEGLALNQLSNDKRLNEMEFYLPLERLQIENLKQILFQHLPKDGANWQQIRDAVDGLYFEEVEGYLKGFIDLIFEHDGKYYVADYKSNSLADYQQDSLFDAMSHSHYYLQYLLYCVALHRYLEQRIPDYSWETHIGGVYYLFVRGMSPTEKSATKYGGVPRQSSAGLFFHKPSLELIEALDGLFMRLTPVAVANG